ncbi:MAG: CHAP domain-containing protein [Gammaproteobacteria bacterium]|nr:CHAP domain-containing protein [Gammaproteobacteria bacterium]
MSPGGGNRRRDAATGALKERRHALLQRPLGALALAAALAAGLGGAPGPVPARESLSADPHYTTAGFFDVHVCNWPERPLFFLVLFSTERFAEVTGVEVTGPAGEPVARLDPAKFIRLDRPGKPEKRVFIQQVEVPAGAANGWYTARVRLTDGQEVLGRDYVVITALPRAGGLAPGRDAVLGLPAAFTWAPVAGAARYQVYLRDLWQPGENPIHQSKLLTDTRYEVPAGVLKPGGHYSWKVHARDADGHVLLGDYNHGSQSEWTPFEVAEPLAGAADADPGSLPAACAIDCVSRYGEVLGTADPGVPAYSNCSSACVSREPHLQGGRFLGVRWQCVEYARRWLYTAKGAVFGDVDVAADFWRRVDALTRVADGGRIPLTAHRNGSPSPPVPGDLLVYGDEFLGTGHLAVVLRVDPAGGSVEVAEQNYDNRPWSGDYARRIDLVELGGRFWLLDAYLIGWKRAEGSHEAADAVVAPARPGPHRDGAAGAQVADPAGFRPTLE